MQLALIQQTCNLDKQANLAKTHGYIQQAAQQGAELILLQELHGTLYFCQQEHPDYFAWAESLTDSITLQQLRHWAATYQVVLVGSIFEKRMTGVYNNTAVVIEKDGSLAGKYRKMHIPDDPSFYEKYYFIPGDLGFNPIQTSVGCLGVLVCWDQWFPEAARIMALKGADILLYPTAIGWDEQDSSDTKQRQHYAWRTVQQGHAIANHLPVAACNRVGYEASSTLLEEGIEFWGQSFISDAQGQLLQEGSSSEEEIIMANVDFQLTRALRHTWPYFRDRRIEAYDQLTTICAEKV